MAQVLPTRHESREPFDEEAVRRALAHANANVLRLALYQATRDPDLAGMAIKLVPLRSGAFTSYALADDHVGAVIDKAVAFLRAGAPLVDEAAAPSADDLHAMMQMFTGLDLSPKEFALAVEELALDDFPRDVRWSGSPPAERLKDFKVAIVGAGISGLAAATLLARLGIPYVVLERQAEVGGTWSLNTYPEARVDTSSFLYQFRFEKKYPWPEFFASQPETRRFLNHVADKYGITPNIRLGVELTEAIWDEEAALWRIGLRGREGQSETLAANAIISGSGLFSMANLPDIPGIGDFARPIMHTASWRHESDLAGQRIALIGNGSSGVQITAHLAEIARSLTIYQRTPNWIMESTGYKQRVPAELHWIIDHVPFYWNWFSFSNHITSLGLQALQGIDRAWQQQGGAISERNDVFRASLIEYIGRKLGDRDDLIAKVTPTHSPLARRPVMDNGWYDALLRDNVELVTTGITRFTPTGIVSGDGNEREFDHVVLGAGFKTSKYLWPARYVGRGGVDLESLWARDGARAYLSMTMPGFPNFFMMFGPNSQQRAGSFSSWAEKWARYSVSLIVRMLERGRTSVECRPEVFDSFNAEIDTLNRQIVWETDPTGYFVNEHGRGGVNMPLSVEEYHERISSPNEQDFIFKGVNKECEVCF